jgi:GTPase-activating protein SAC7
MSDTLDDGLREQLAAALLGWGGDLAGGLGAQRLSRDTIDSTGNSSGRATPKAVPAMIPRQGQIQGVMDLADEEGRTTVDDDIDADSVALDASDTFDGWSGDNAHQQARRTTNIPNPAAQKPLPPIPFDTPIVSPPPEMSCRISRFPFSHPCDMPELMPDQEDMYGTEPSPSASAPVTPNVLPGVFRPSVHAPLPNPGLGPYLNPAPEPEVRHKMRKMSIQSYHTAVSEDLCKIDEEESDVNTDGVSLLSPTEVSGGTYRGGESDSTRVDRQGFLTVASGHWRSVSSLGSGSSGESRPTHAIAASRRASNLFSRIRNGGRTEEQCLEKRSLTPIHLDTPPRRQGDPDNELLTPDGLTPTSPSYNSSRAEPASTTSRFFNRMPWLGDSQPKKPEAVFGVDLKESIRVAPMKIRISHKGRSTSYRTFPLAVYKSCDFIRRAGMSAETFMPWPLD